MPRTRLLPYGYAERAYTVSQQGLDVALRKLDDEEATDAAKGIPIEMDEATRRLVRLATAAFSLEVQCEQSAPKKGEIEKIRKLRALALSLQKTFPYPHNGPYLARPETKAFVAKHLDDWDRVAGRFWLTAFADNLQDVVSSTNLILAKFSPGSPANHEIVAGEAWDTWVAILHMILMKAGLPAENRQDGEPAGQHRHRDRQKVENRDA